MKKNKKLLILVSCLLLVGGISFAYFIASTIFRGEGSNVGGTTAIINDSELRVEGTLEFQDLDIYPGHQNASSIKVTATGDNALIPYHLVWNGTNTLNTSLNYTVYKTSSEVEVTSSCEKEKGVVDGVMMYYEECTISNLEQLGTPISSGTINANDTKVIFTKDEFITATSDGMSVYYYIILEYPNLDESQNSDIGGSFSGEVTVEESDAEPDINIIAAYIKQEDGSYEEVSDIPQSGYIINTEKSVCSNGAMVSTDLSDNTTKIDSLTKSGTSCYLYFDEYNPYAAKEHILLNYDTVLTRNDFSQTVTETTTGTIYKSLDETQYDNDGEVYYFAGNPTDNWVYFGGYWWRIIRINGNGSIRIIYQGTSANITGDGTQIETRAFNTSYNDNAYVGYMYGTVNSSTFEATHTNENDSTIKQTLDNWYGNISGLTLYSQYLDGDAGFCGDRQLFNGFGYSANGTSFTSDDRLRSNKKPIFKCNKTSDLYTTTSSETGNKILTYPIGLISADEAAYAGSVYNTYNVSYFLYTHQDYWTMSPFGYNNGAINWYLHNSGGLEPSTGLNRVSNVYGVRPVINLKADVQLTGSGTTTDPYKVEGA